MTQQNEEVKIPEAPEASEAPVTEKQPASKTITASEAISKHFYKTAHTDHVGWLECDYNVKDVHMFIHLVTGNRRTLPADYKLIEVTKEEATQSAKVRRKDLGMVTTTTGKQVKYDEEGNEVPAVKKSSKSKGVKPVKERKISRASIIDKCFLDGGMTDIQIVEEVIKVLPEVDKKSIKSQIGVRIYGFKKAGRKVEIDATGKIKMYPAEATNSQIKV